MEALPQAEKRSDSAMPWQANFSPQKSYFVPHGTLK